MSQIYFYPPGRGPSAAPAGGATAANQVIEIGLLTGIEANQTNGTQVTQVSNFPSPTPDPNIAARLTGSLTPVAFDEVDLTYVVAGNGVGQIETATYKLATVVVKTVTLTYDGSDRLISAVAT